MLILGNLSRRTDRQGPLTQWQKEMLKADAFAFATWNKGLLCNVHGFIWKSDVEGIEPKDARRGSHTNYEIDHSILLPMTRLVDEIRSRE